MNALLLVSPAHHRLFGPFAFHAGAGRSASVRCWASLPGGIPIPALADDAAGRCIVRVMGQSVARPGPAYAKRDGQQGCDLVDKPIDFHGKEAENRTYVPIIGPREEAPCPRHRPRSPKSA